MEQDSKKTKADKTDMQLRLSCLPRGELEWEICVQVLYSM